jgi:hypothetical protein
MEIIGVVRTRILFLGVETSKAFSQMSCKLFKFNEILAPNNKKKEISKISAFFVHPIFILCLVLEIHKKENALLKITARKNVAQLENEK